MKYIDIRPLLIKKALIDRDNIKNRNMALEKRGELYDKAINHNLAQAQKALKVEAFMVKIEKLKDKLVALHDKIESVKEKMIQFKDELAMQPRPEPLQSTDIPMPRFIEYDLTNLNKTIGRVKKNNEKVSALNAKNSLQSLANNV